MTQEEKELLLKDLCKRLLTGVKMKRFDGKVVELTPLLFATFAIENHKPYLRSLSSMTEEEYLTIYDMCRSKDLEFKSSYGSYWGDFKTKKYIPNFMYNSNQLDYLISHHFDYHGLIPMDLALEASDGMYN